MQRTTESVNRRTVLERPLELPNGFVIPNRLAKAALSEGLGDRDGGPGTRIRTLYRRWADSGVGLTITGNVMIDRRHGLGEPGNVAVEDDRHGDQLRSWAEITKSGGSRAWVQINHPGRQTPRTLTPHPVAPSPVALPGSAKLFATPRELTGAEIEDLVSRYATTARIVTDAGFDGVQIHGAHGYLVSQFLSPLANQRTDGWGGTPEKRRRFVLEVFRAIRAEVGADVPIAIKLNSADFQKGGFGHEESLEVVHALAAEGLDLLEVSGGTYTSAAMLGVDVSLRESTRRREAYFLEYAEKVRAMLPQLPLMLTGGFRTADGMVDAIESGAIDVVGLGRPLTVQPDFPADLLAGRVDESVVNPRRSGIKLLDNLTELTYYTVQMWRMAKGKEPAPDRHAAINVTQYLLNNGIESLRSPRA
ncbi:2,4-dienoyl-CoA reductase-like NADH-dependent reductase (Old Yellow Enzyme family) [Nocardioides thalensis]|uniref:2,4-dienoyl-CoA reductase-like NADH-dependent reductase (Old Yellow Enzyme family) n=1 Tax=Nocardioides thalensis TaxID=1914755 RepID=A0A853C539_9ACTN|nr:NADH:flavin oxidoreductase/NADH oxidase family protein [Nocardioides thalensis]NYJ01792.1 2,4-dienoyl-CoA reductase-like NADH-dependent reductase (Old Yellow Enzyme family) [Nocardioides thalensis]